MDEARQLQRKEWRLKAARYCAYQERSVAEVRSKLASLGCEDHEIHEIILWLEDEKFLNESRFAETYVVSKLRHNQWGKIKIKHQLRMKGVPEDLISRSINQIDEDEYLGVMRGIMAKKYASLKTGDPHIRNQKVVQYVLSRGFESDLAWKEIHDLKDQ